MFLVFAFFIEFFFPDISLITIFYLQILSSVFFCFCFFSHHQNHRIGIKLKLYIYIYIYIYIVDGFWVYYYESIFEYDGSSQRFYHDNSCYTMNSSN